MRQNQFDTNSTDEDTIVLAIKKTLQWLLDYYRQLFNIPEADIKCNRILDFFSNKKWIGRNHEDRTRKHLLKLVNQLVKGRNNLRCQWHNLDPGGA